MVELIVIIILLKISQLNLNCLCIVVLWATLNIAAIVFMLWDEVHVLSRNDTSLYHHCSKYLIWVYKIEKLGSAGTLIFIFRCGRYTCYFWKKVINRLVHPLTTFHKWTISKSKLTNYVIKSILLNFHKKLILICWHFDTPPPPPPTHTHNKPLDISRSICIQFTNWIFTA